MDGPNMVSDSGYIKNTAFRGGRLGVLVFSQKEIVFSDLSYRCNGKKPAIVEHWNKSSCHSLISFQLIFVN